MGIILGNIFSGMGEVTDLISVSRKKGKEVILIQCMSYFFYALSSIALLTYSNAVQNTFGIIRNLVAYKDIKSRAVDLFLIATPVILGFAVNNIGFVGMLPIIANLIYSFAVFKFKNEVITLKTIMIFTTGMFDVFSLLIQNYVGALSNALTIIYTLRSIVKTLKAKKQTPEQA